MSHAFKITLYIVAALAILQYALLLVLKLSWRRRHPPADEIAKSKAFERRLLNPDWNFYEKHLQRPAPPALRDLFADHALITACALNFADGTGISSFNPLDAESLLTGGDGTPHDLIPIAISDCGDAIYLRPGTAETDTVYITYHDEEKTEVFAPSVAEMVRKLREANPPGIQ